MFKKNKNTGTDNTGNWNSGHWNAGDWNSGNRNSGHWNAGDWNSGNRNSGHGNSGNRNSGHWNAGDWNSGDWNSGAFNTDEPYARLFNRKSNVKMSELVNSDRWPTWCDFTPCVWIEESIMTDEEKREFPTYKTTGGYLKTISYKEAWAVFWRKTSEDNKQKFLSLPNFDAAIFKEITGIETKNSGSRKKAKELREQADKLLSKARELESSL
jgi:hypothetical protein